MFFIFKMTPNWIWYVLPALGLLGFLASYLPQLKTYDFIIKSIACATIVIGIFILGVLYCDNTWKDATKELEAKVAEIQIKSNATNEIIREKLVTKTQVVKTRGEDVIRYIDREVTKADAGCIIPKEFVEAHNRAAEQPK